MIEFELRSENFRAKKNDIEISCRGKYPVKYKSKKIIDFEKDIINQISVQVSQTFTDLVEITYLFFLNHRFLQRDLDNVTATINDCLQMSGVIKNDAYIVHQDCFKYKDAREYETLVVRIKEVDKNEKMRYTGISINDKV